MRVKTVQINWHDKLPIFSVDFDHSYVNSNGGWRFATGGGDNNVRLWRLRTPEERELAPQHPAVEFLASLNRHTAPVNVVRFSPCSSKLASAGDDGVIIIWRQQLSTDTGETPRAPPATLEGGFEDDGFVEPEVWRPVAMLRGSLADICDLAWSPDGNFLVSASVDNTARIWDAREARCLQVLADHSHYVQGVAWDPLGEFIATQSSDRSLRVYRWIAPRDPREIKSGTEVVSLLASHYSMPIASGQKGDDGPEEESALADSMEGVELQSTGVLDNEPMEADDTSALPVPVEAVAAAPTANRSQRLFHDDNLASFFRRPSISPDGRLLAAAAGVQRDRSARNTSYIWARDALLAPPVLSLAGHAKPVVATRWAPCRFAAAKDADASASGAWLADDIDSRMMLAVASQSSVAIYDTSMGGRAIGLMSGLHYAAITDLAWTRDGSHMILTSIDGFASVVAISQPSAAIDIPTPLAVDSRDAASGATDHNRDPPSADGAVSTQDLQHATSASKKGKKRLAPTLVSQL
ncbi:Chromatin assembly factor 1 subunit [Coemansia linderi]|uniref:Chromatin assembly factor 1 subunit n=1 Tax=Coemansia linderi TaxID=2663919 RepID=A0ACC1KLL2_9FUNG|nr:Chromatin assembly factor 1 subunit [Coemansia linderi]